MTSHPIIIHFSADNLFTMGSIVGLKAD